MDMGQMFQSRTRRQWRLGRFKFPSGFRLARWIVMIGVGGFIVAFLLLALAFAWYSRNLPSPDKIVRRDGFSTKILSKDGDVLYDVYGDLQREPVNFADVPETLKQATVAVEDKHFYSHQGFDALGMMRGIFRTVVLHQTQGGSTLTQQLVKNVLLTSDRSVQRKIKEFVLAVQIEKKFTKDQILQMYLQETPYGGSAVGAEVAANRYFGKPLKDLSLVESAILAGMPQSPTRYSPYGSNPTAYVGRTEQVLRRMREDGYITSDEEKNADTQLKTIEFKPAGGMFKAPHFVQYVKDTLVDQFGEDLVENGGLNVTTTLDLPLQETMQTIVSEEVDKVASLKISNGALLVMNPQTGEILSMVGSKDFASTEIDGQWNVTTHPRQPGSAIKPVTYVAAFRKGYTPSTMMTDAKISFDSGNPDKPYEPENYDGKFRGPVQLRYALASSLNVPSVQLLQLVGLKDMLTLAYDMGLSTLEPTQENMSRLGLSVTLGGGEVSLLDLVSAYSAFGNGGMKVQPVAILKVEDAKGKTLYEYHPVKGKQVLSPQEAFLITNILSDNNARALTFSANSLLNTGTRPIAVKTGTTNDKRDNWAIGWSRSVIVGAWVGNNDNSQMKEVASGVSGASPIWRRAILEALTTYPSKDFEIPQGVSTRDVDVISGYVAHDGWPSRTEYFIDGTVPDGTDIIHENIAVCKRDGKLGSPVDIAKGDTENKEFIVLRAPAELPDADRAKWQEGIDAWIAGQGDVRYHPPTELCSSTDDAVLNIKQPSDHARLSNDIDWEVEVVSGGKRTEQVEMFVDGASKQTLTSAPWRSTIHLSDGIYELKFKARLEGGKEVDRTIKIGVNRNWDEAPTPTPTPTSKPTATPTPVPTAIPSLSPTPTPH